MQKAPPATQADIAQLKGMAEAIHVAARGLAMTYGVFHGVNFLRSRDVLSPHVAQAINSIQHDLLHLMAIRACALSELGSRSEDAPIRALERRITHELRERLIAEELE